MPVTDNSTTVSVIIPTYNRVACVGDAIDSVLAQTHAIHEIIVVDDGSTDGSADWIRLHYPGVRLLRQENHGVSHARNQAIALANGDWFALLDSDDQWYPDKIATQMAALKAEPGKRLCHCDEHWFRNGQRINPMQKHKKHGGSIFALCLPLCVISPSAALIHRSVFEQFGGFDESLPACEDYDFWLRFCACEPIVFVNQPLLAKHGGHADQLSRRYWGMDRFRLQALAGVLRSGTLTAEHADLAQTMFMHKFRIYCAGSIKRNRHEEVASLQRSYADIITAGQSPGHP